MSGTGLSRPTDKVRNRVLFVSPCSLNALEPVGAKAPTFSSASSSFTFKHRIGDQFSLLCQAQAFPVPLIRYTWFRFWKLPIRHRLCEINTQQKGISHDFLYVDTRSPIYIFRIEPVGSRAPSFPSEFIGNVLRKAGGQSFALLCQAQAFPVPLIRCTS